MPPTPPRLHATRTCNAMLLQGILKKKKHSEYAARNVNQANNCFQQFALFLFKREILNNNCTCCLEKSIRMERILYYLRTVFLSLFLSKRETIILGLRRRRRRRRTHRQRNDQRRKVIIPNKSRVAFFFFFFDNRGYTHVHTRTFSSPLFLVAHHVVQFKKHWEESDVYD